MKLLKALATVAGLTGVSRVAGFIRDILMASILGAGAVADAFFVALKLPNLFRRITAEGALTVAFVPTYTEKDEKEGRSAAEQYAGQVASILMLILLPLSILAVWFMPAIIAAIAPGFNGEAQRFDLAVDYTRVSFPYLAMISLVALMGGILNAHGKYAPFAAAPILFNICLIIGLLLSGYTQTVGHALSYAIFASGILQLIWLYQSFKRIQFKFNFRKPELNTDIKRLFSLMGPGILGAGVVQINLFIDVILASTLPAGAISALYYADRLNQLPLGIVGIAMGTALLPMLSRAVAGKNKAESQSLFDQSLFYGLLLSLPAAIALCVIPDDLIRTLFEHGAFTSSDTVMAARVLQAYAIGLPAFIVAKVFSTLYFAHQDTATPVKISIVTTIANTLLSITLIQFIGVVGIALATGITAWLQVILFSYKMRKDAHALFSGNQIKKFAKIALSAAIMAVFLLMIDQLWFLEEASKLLLVGKLFVLVFSGMASYTASVLMLRLVKVSDIRILERF